MDRSVTDFNIRLRTIRLRELFVGIIVTLILTGLIMVIFPEIYESDELFFIAVLLIGALLFVWALRDTKGLDRNIDNVFEEHNRKEILYVFAINLLFAFLFTFLISSLDMLINFTDPTMIALDNIETIEMDSTYIILDAIGAIIFAPIMEELIFRGVMFNRLKIRIGIIPAMIISSAIFALGHEFGGITSAFLFGICMCLLYLKTDNILIPMSVHFINNVVATVIYYTNFDILISEFPWIIPSTIISIIGTAYLIKYIIQETRKVKKKYS